MNVGSIVFEPAPVFMKPVDHSIFFTPPPQPAATTGQPMQLYCYVKQQQAVREFLLRADINKQVRAIRDAAELERLCLHGQVFVYISQHANATPWEMFDTAIAERMEILCIETRG